MQIALVLFVLIVVAVVLHRRHAFAPAGGDAGYAANPPGSSRTIFGLLLIMVALWLLFGHGDMRRVQNFVNTMRAGM
jgi:protein-S-isoprenylcysteine O-methyltransferase Ste14